MIYSAMQTLYFYCMINEIPIEIIPIRNQGVVFTLGPSPLLNHHCDNILQAGNGFNDFLTMTFRESTITCQTGFLTLELACRKILSVIVPDLENISEPDLVNVQDSSEIPNTAVDPKTYLQFLLSQMKKRPSKRAGKSLCHLKL